VTVFVFVTVSAFLCFEYCQNRMGIVMTGNIRRITKIASKTYVPTLRGMRFDDVVCPSFDVYFSSPLGPTICSALTSDIFRTDILCSIANNDMLAISSILVGMLVDQKDSRYFQDLQPFSE
jgi:hypothetical protein